MQAQNPVCYFFLRAKWSKSEEMLFSQAQDNTILKWNPLMFEKLP